MIGRPATAACRGAAPEHVFATMCALLATAHLVAAVLAPW